MPVLWRPLAFYRELVTREIAWGSALVPIILWMTATVLTSTVMAIRNQEVTTVAVRAVGGPDVPVGLGVLVAIMASLFGIAVTFWLPTITVIVVGVIRGSEGRRLLECSAIACWSQLPWGLASLVWVATLFELEPVNMAGVTASELGTVMQAYQENMQRTPTMLTFNLVGSFSGLWLVVLQCCALRVVSRLPVGGAWTVGVITGGLFVVAPWAIQRFF